MDNRRSSFRCAFRLDERLGVELLIPGKAPRWGLIVDLSIRGMGVSLADPDAIGPPGQHFPVRFVIPPGTRFTLPAVLVRASGPTQPILGIEFLPHPDPRFLAAREKTLWNFLLESQRRRRRELLNAAS